MMSFEDQKQETIKIYSELIAKHGDDPRSSHWTNYESQAFRFKQLCKIADLNNKSILDVGCGIGDLNTYLLSNYRNINYTGIDINSNAIELAKKKHCDTKFHVVDLTCDENVVDDIKEYDYVMINGVFNNNFLGSTDYLELLVKLAFNKTKIGLAFNFISSRAKTIDSGMAYHDTIRVMQFCMDNLSDKLSICHKYDRADVSVFVYR